MVSHWTSWISAHWFLDLSYLFIPLKVKVAQSCLTLCNPMDYTAHGVLQAKILEWVAFPFSRGSSQPRDQTQVSCIADGFCLSAEQPGKPKNTGVGSLSLLQGIFQTQELNQGLLHCRQILYQLSYQGNYKLKFSFKKCDLQCLLHRFGVKSFTILSHIKY